MTDALEICKVAIPAIASSSLVAYYYQKRLKRLGSFEVVTNTLLNRLLEGAADVHRSADTLRLSIAAIGVLIADDDIDLAGLRRAKGDFDENVRAFADRLTSHRIYITKLIPFGGSASFNDILTVIDGYTALIILNVESGKLDGRKLCEWRLEIDKSAVRFAATFAALREAIESVKSDIFSGVAP